jgi:hypothetical protein
LISNNWAGNRTTAPEKSTVIGGGTWKWNQSTK